MKNSFMDELEEVDLISFPNSLTKGSNDVIVIILRNGHSNQSFNSSLSCMGK